MVDFDTADIRALTKGQKGTLIFEEGGDIELDGVGFGKSDGEKCKTEQDAIAIAIGGKVTGQTHKPEFQREHAKSKKVTA